MKFYIILFTGLFSVSLYCQDISNFKTYYNWFDSVIGVNNTNLLNGTEFKDEFKTLEDNHQYFFKREFSYGNIVYNGQPYYNASIKYNVHDDELIIRLLDYTGYIAIKLVKEHVERFQINNNTFINSNTLKLNKTPINNLGFYEVLFMGNNISIFKKHFKSKQERKNDKFAFTEFIHKELFLVNFKGDISVISSKKDFIKLDPKLKKTIDSFYRNKRYLIKLNYNTFLTELGETLNDTITKNK